MFGQKFFDGTSWVRTCFAFVCFSLASSSTYLLNDVFDKDKDAHHPSKLKRPIASGKISTRIAVVAALVLFFVSVLGGLYLDKLIAWVILFYLVLNFLYSIWLKHKVIIDVMCIGTYFMLRLIVGSIAVSVELSHWIIICGGLLTLFLGFSKRYAEFSSLENKAIDYRPVLELYDGDFLKQMILIVASSLVISYTLYTVDDRTVQTFGTRNLLYSVPFVYYGIFRYLYDLLKRKIHKDPTYIFFKDKVLQCNIILWVLVVVVVIYMGS